MNIELIIPDECIPYIRWQRSRFSPNKVPSDAEVKRRYADWICEDFAGMEPHFPAQVNSILEIGCGVGALEVLVKRKFPDATLALLDGNGSNVVGGYRPTSEPYNSRVHTEMLLAANGVNVDRWHDIDTKDLLEYDLIISLASWGYHYPFSTYNVKGFVVCDLRRGKEAEEATIKAARKAGGKKIFDGVKYDRMAWRVS